MQSFSTFKTYDLSGLESFIFKVFIDKASNV